MIEVIIMRNFFYRLGSSFARFMYGRNGADQLNQAIVWTYLGLWIVQLLLGMVVKSSLVYSVIGFVMTVLAVVLLWRTFSKNLTKRRAENARFLSWWNPIRSRMAGARARRQDRDHKYFTCKSCKTICRVPAGKGRIEITCPKCGSKIIGKS